MNRVAAGVAMGVTAMSLGLSTTAVAADTEWAGFVENATYVRDGVGLSKFRNTAQAEFSKQLESDGWDNVSINGTLRATYDGVYDLNSDEFGKDAQAGYLGENWHGQDTSTAILAPGTPFPCENDPALCKNLDGYMDQSEDDARYPDFNDQLDFIRELYISADKQLESGTVLNLSFGKQQVVWGKTDLFRVLDVINPVDYSRHNIYDELEDIRIPQWMLTAEWRMGPDKVFDDSNFSLVWNIDKFRPSNLGTCGQPYAILDAGCFFASRINGGGPYVINDVVDYDWSLRNSQFGAKWEGVYGDTTFSLNALHYRQQLPSIHFLGGPGNNFGLFDIHFPEVNLLGGSIDYYSMDQDAVWRLEMAYTEGEELARDTDGYKKTDMLRYVIGFDKNIIIPELGTSSAFLLSTQLFGEHILDHERDMPNKKDNWIATLLFKGFYMNNRLSPQIIIAHDFAAEATAIAPSIDYLINDNWKVNAAFNIKEGGNKAFPWSAAGGAAAGGQTEPLARFLNGPIGVANQEDEFQLTVRYSF
ncbi:MAG: DUF1302 domain-containing protein [Oceanospirillales bacterium]|nr:DUF1302 domain-containing protein [Oceanospirillales bacterium]